MAAVRAVRAYLDRDAFGVAPDPALAERGAVHLAAAGLPGAPVESWRHTDPAPLLTRAVAPAPPGAVAPAADALPRLAGALRRVWVNGQPAPALAEGTPPPGVRLWALEDAADGVGERLSPEHSGFAALNALSWRHGAGLALEAGVKLVEPVHLLWWSQSGDQPWDAHPRLLLRLAAGASATVVIHQAGAAAVDAFLGSVLEVDLAAGAALDLVLVDQQGAQGFALSQVAVHGARDSRLGLWLLDDGAGWVRRELELTLAEPGATLALQGLVRGRGALRVDNQVVVHHRAPQTHSLQQTRAVLQDRARAVFGGGVRVAVDAQGITARQANATLLLSRRAEVITRPALEILADEVQCSHGASVGQLDETALFYLQSRGLDRETARTLLIDAFARAALPDLPVPAVLEWVFGPAEADAFLAATV